METHLRSKSRVVEGDSSNSHRWRSDLGEGTLGNGPATPGKSIATDSHRWRSDLGEGTLGNGPATPGKSIATALASDGGRKRLREEDRCCCSR
ncbi:hypothetical protein JCGZ_17118 [Jatropha curcas]|uniref:Uncharacterized protein n=1 Tax=Jatropha curcas TaxID=180498 RepID=A0A067KEV2_JATCU|nr:hypothetical protein JCGZ_17118 [Jatropha curcas]